MWVGLTYSGLPKAIFESPFNISLRLTRPIFCFWFVVTCRNSMLSVYLKVLKHYDWILENCSCTEESNTQPWISIVHYDLSNPQQDWGIRRCYYQGCLCPNCMVWKENTMNWTDDMTKIDFPERNLGPHPGAIGIQFPPSEHQRPISFSTTNLTCPAA